MASFIPLALGIGQQIFGAMNRHSATTRANTEQQRQQNVAEQEKARAFEAEKKRRLIMTALAKQYGIDSKLPQEFWDNYANPTAPTAGSYPAPQKSPGFFSELLGGGLNVGQELIKPRNPQELVKPSTPAVGGSPYGEGGGESFPPMGAGDLPTSPTPARTASTTGVGGPLAFDDYEKRYQGGGGARG